MFRTALIALLLLSTTLGSAASDDQRTIDSLKAIVESNAHDTVRLKAMIQWDGMIWYSDPDLDLELNKRIVHETTELLRSGKSYPEKVTKWYYKALAYGTNSLGVISMGVGEYEQAIPKFDSAYAMHKLAGNMSGMASALNNKGICFQERGHYPQALEMYLECLSIERSRNDRKGEAKTYNNIGIVYEMIGDYEKAMEYYRKSFAIKQSIDFVEGLASTYQNMGNIKKEVGDLDSALYFFEESLKSEEMVGNRQGISDSYFAIGTVYSRLGHYSSAMQRFRKALEINREIDNRYADAIIYDRIGQIFIHKEVYDSALVYCDSSRVIAYEGEMLKAMRNACQCFYKAYKGLGKDSEALVYHEQYIELRDSINNQERDREIIRMELQFDYDQKVKQDSLMNAQEKEIQSAKLEARSAELEAEKEEKKRLKDQSYFVFGALGIALLAGGFVFNRFRVTRKQRNIIAEQKEKVDDAFSQLEVKNKEVVDSITYAKRIQEAILPSIESFRKDFPSSFIMYRPKDIVAGDFYWSERSGDWALFAAADCTGHGVPGAMVSVVCHNALNRSVREYGMFKPGMILDKTRDIVEEQLSKSQEKVKDGMDIALCALNRKTNQLLFSGAHNPLWLIRKEEDKVEVYAASKQAIGKVDNPESFKTHEIEVKPGDSIYIFSDGYVDQFGGEKGKKYKHKPFMDFLKRTNHLSPEAQLEALNVDFDRWKGELQQLDDVCVVGVRV